MSYLQNANQLELRAYHVHLYSTEVGAENSIRMIANFEYHCVNKIKSIFLKTYQWLCSHIKAHRKIAILFFGFDQFRIQCTV